MRPGRSAQLLLSLLTLSDICLLTPLRFAPSLRPFAQLVALFVHINFVIANKVSDSEGIRGKEAKLEATRADSDHIDASSDQSSVPLAVAKGEFIASRVELQAYRPLQSFPTSRDLAPVPRLSQLV